MLSIIGWIATLLLAIGYFPQCYKLFKTNDTTGLSFKTFSAIASGLMFWIIYAVAKNEIQLLISSCISFIQVSYILYKIRFQTLTWQTFKK